MKRLLSEQDLEFLRSQEQCSSATVKRWQRTQRRIFRMYLKDLAGDFQRLHTYARALAAESPERHSGLIELLVQQQYVFWKTLAAVELRLALNTIGVASVDAGRLLAVFEGMGKEISLSTHSSSSLA